MCYDNVFLQYLLRTGDWCKAGLHWRSHFFIRGQLYRDKKSGDVFRALNSNHRIAPLWPMKPLDTSRLPAQAAIAQGYQHIEQTPRVSQQSELAAEHPANSGYWTPDVSPNAKPHFIAMLDWEDIEAATCQAISPLGMVARGRPWRCVPRGIVILQTSCFEHPCVTAAKKSFLGCSKDDLLKLAREKGICIVGQLGSNLISQFSKYIFIKATLQCHLVFLGTFKFSHLRLSLGQLIAELIQVCLPWADANKIAAIMEEVLPTAEEAPLEVDFEDLKAVLEGDAAILQERREKATDKTSNHATMEREIAEQAAQLRRAGRVKSQAAGQPLAVKRDAPEAAIAHWAGKGGAHWTAKDRQCNSSHIKRRIDR